MSLTGQETSSAENFKLIIDALANYTKETGIDLFKNRFAANLEQWRSPEDILQLLEDREKAFKEHRDKNRTLINCLSPVVNVFHRFSGILGKAAGLVSRTCSLVSLLT
jgi:fungal STAND N-terminal Goodbye domain